MLPNPEVREVTLQDYFAIVKKRWVIILAFLLILPSITTIVVFTATPIYRATASIIIEKSAPKITKIEEVQQSQAYYKDIQYYQTQYKILGSRTLAERVYNEKKSLKSDPYYKDSSDPAGKLHSQVRIEPVKNSQIVLINIDDSVAERAAAIANAWANAYIHQDIESRGSSAKGATTLLETQLVDLKNKLRQSEEEMNKFLQENKIFTSVAIERQNEQIFEDLKKNKSDLELKITEAKRRYKEKHPKIIALKAQLEDINNKIQEETEEMINLKQKTSQYNILKREVESNQKLYTDILSRSKETDISEKLGITSVSVVDLARTPKSPYKPQKSKSIMMAILLSLFCGIGLSFFLEYLDSTLRTAEDVSLHLNLPFLGYMPAIPRTKSELEKSMICYKDPTSITAEFFRALRTSMLFCSQEDKPLKTILITSSIPEEGKSFLSSNLSAVFSNLNERVVLVDLDARRPKLHKNFQIEQKLGVSDFFTGKVTDVEKIIKPTCLPNLFLITSGPVLPNATEIISSVKVRKLIDELKGKFDRIFIDSPPILSVSDTSIVASVVDGIVLVVKGASTRVQVIVHARNKLVETKGRILGVVINNLEPEKEDKNYYQYYYYGTKEGNRKKRKDY